MITDLERRICNPLFVGEFANVTPAMRARELTCEPCPVTHAVDLVRLWHSRLPKCQDNPWQFAFRAHKDGVTYAVALWNNPSTRSLPHHWLELRRMACSPDSPRYTASYMLGWMVRYFRAHHRHREKCISYQDLAVHQGTIYKAAGWIVEYVGKPRVRHRGVSYHTGKRWSHVGMNGAEADQVGKARWAISLK